MAMTAGLFVWATLASLTAAFLAAGRGGAWAFDQIHEFVCVWVCLCAWVVSLFCASFFSRGHVLLYCTGTCVSMVRSLFSSWKNIDTLRDEPDLPLSLLSSSRVTVCG